MSNAPSLAEILSALTPEQRSVIETQLRTTSRAAFQHVSNSPYYDRSTNEKGYDRITSTGIPDPNKLKVSYQHKIGRRQAGYGVYKQRDGTVTLYSTGAPVENVIIGKDGKMSIIIKDTFSDGEKQFIKSWQTSKFVERPSTATKLGEQTTTETSNDESDATDTTSDTPTAPVAMPNDAQIKVALIKAKAKPTAENIGLVKDLMSQGGQSLTEAASALA